LVPAPTSSLPGASLARDARTHVRDASPSGVEAAAGTGDGEAAPVSAALREALRVLASDPGEIVRSLVEDFGYDDRSAALRARAFGGALSADGRVPRAEAEAALATVAGAAGAQPPPVDALYAPEALS
jgi:hypothetical protein